MFLLWAIYRWIYIMQIKAFISKRSDVIFWKPRYFDVECIWTPAILMLDSWRISLLLPGLILVVSKCAGEEIPAEQDFEIINVCKSLVAFFLSRIWNRAQHRFFLSPGVAGRLFCLILILSTITIPKWGDSFCKSLKGWQTGPPPDRSNASICAGSALLKQVRLKNQEVVTSLHFGCVGSLFSKRNFCLKSLY